MALVLAIEPDPRQAAVLKRVVRDRAHAEIAVVDSKDAAVAAISAHMPDLILVTALLSPRDEQDLVSHLRALNGADHLQTITIPLLATAGQSDGDDEGGFFSRTFRRKKAGSAAGSVGCDPRTFGDQVAGYLRAAEDARAARQASQQFSRDESVTRTPSRPETLTVTPAPASPQSEPASASAEGASEPIYQNAPEQAFTDPDYAFSWRSSSDTPGTRADTKHEAPAPAPAWLAPETAFAEVVSARPIWPEPAPAAPAAEEPVAIEPAPSAPLPVESVLAEAIPVEAVLAKPAREEPLLVEPVLVEPILEEPVLTEPLLVEPVPAEPIAAEPVRAEPVLAEPVLVEPVPAEPVLAEPVPAEPVLAEPAREEPVARAEPVRAEPVRAEPVAAEPVRAEPVRAEPAREEPVRAEPVVPRAPSVAKRVAKAVSARLRVVRSKPKPALKPLKRLPPLAIWAHIEQTDSDTPPRPPLGGHNEDVAALMASLRVPPAVLAVSYPRRPYIRRMRTAA